MNEQLARAYDRSPYPDYSFWRTHPDHLGMLGRLFGLPTASPDRCKVLEIGCAVGGNIIPMAAGAPGSQFVGVDLSGIQIARASTVASTARVRNIIFIHGDFREVPAHLGPFDYIICHGVFAWVDAATQAAILAFIRERLAPSGVAFVSYNAYPGHHMVDMVRKLLLLHTANAPDLVTKNQQALAIMRFLARRGAKVEGDWRTPFLEREIEAVRHGGLDLLEHDYCASQSHPKYFVDFVADLGKVGLAYLADSQPWDMYLENFDPEIVETLKPLGNVVLQAQYLDFINNTRFRETLVCHQEAPISRSIPAERITQFRVGHALAEEPTLDGLAEDLPVQIKLYGGTTITVSQPSIRLALRRLWQHGRHLPTFDELTQEVAADLRSHRPHDAEQPDLPVRLAEQLLRFFFATAVRFALRTPPIARTLPERPASGRYQRYMATQQRPLIANLGQESLTATPAMHALLPLLDGTRTVAELAALSPAPVDELLAELRRIGYILDPALVPQMA